MLTNNLIIECANAARQLADEIASARSDDSLTMDLPPEEFLSYLPRAKMQKLSSWCKISPRAKFIYVFSVIGGDVDALLRLYRDAKEREKKKKGKRTFAREGRASSTLYVGSSRSLPTRIGQHLGHKNETVYSMQLRHWLPGDAIESLKLQVWRFPVVTSQPVLQAIEDYVWAKAQPMLGKQGGR